MDSLQWVDETYIQKHKSEDPNTLRAMYYPNLRMYSTHGETSKQRTPMDAALAFLIRYGRRAGISLVIYLLSYIPYVGRFVLPAASFYTFNNAVGPIPAMIIFGSGIFLPRRYLIVFLQSYFSSRSLMRELVIYPFPYVFSLGKSRLISFHSWNPTSPVCASLQPKRNLGFTTVKAFSSASASASTFS